MAASTASIAPASDAPEPPSAVVRRRLAAWRPVDAAASWYWTGAVTLLALVLRLVNISNPPQKIFDEVYYAKDAHDLLNHGYELNKEGTGPGLVAHPPLGKWCIALGEWLFGYNSLGWRFSAAVVGALSVLILARVARRMFRSTLLGCLAGLLLSLDGLHFVSSRTALLDIFLMFFCLASFACLVLDRDQRRDRLHTAWVAADERGEQLTTAPRRSGWRNWPWWRILAAVLLGAALGVKWSAIWFLPAFLVLILVWEIQSRRSAGIRRPISDAIGWETGWIGLFVLVAFGTFLASYSGWFATDGGWERHWAEEHDAGVWYLPDALVSLWHYQYYIYEFHSHLTTPHDYQSTPYSWFYLGRPVLYYYESDGPCGAANCSSTVLALGNPALWWTFVAAFVVCLWRALTRKDWRAFAIVMLIVAAIVPWMFYPDRTMYFFYALPALPFLVLAVTMVAGMILGKPDATTERRLIGAMVVGVYVLVVAVAFAYFYPIYTAEIMPYGSWHDRMWLDSWI